MKNLPLLDLHGYKVADVADAVDHFLTSSQKKKHGRIRIMTGKGTGQVRQAVIDYLKLGGFPFSYDKNEKGQVNQGILLVFLDDDED